MTRQVRALAALLLTCFGLLTIAVWSQGGAMREYREDLEYYSRKCEAERQSKEGEYKKDCQRILYRTLDDPVALLTGGLFVATVALFWVTYLLYRSAVRQSAEATRFFIQEKRPWVGPPKIAAHRYDKTYQFDFFLENTGGTPAIGVHMGAELRDDPRNDFESLSRMYDQLLRNEPDRGTRFTIIPGDTLLVTSARENPYLSVEVDPADHPTRTVKIISGSIFYGPRINGQLCRTNFHAPIEIKDGTVRVDRVWAIDVS